MSDPQTEIDRLRDRQHVLGNQFAGQELRHAVFVAEVGGKLDLIVDKLEGSAEQRDRMEAKTNAIESHLRELNGRTRKSENAIAVLQAGTAQCFTTGMTTKQKAAVAGGAGGVVVIFELLHALQPMLERWFAGQ